MKRERVCIVCARHESANPALRWVGLRPVRALKGRRPYIDAECWADISEAFID